MPVYLRKLKEDDAELMLEWMHDPSVVEKLQTDFSKKTIDDCKRFIKASLNDANNVHLAIADDNDCYLGTVSLKNICEDVAEFAITIRTAAMGKGVSIYAMKEIIRIGFEKEKLQSIYWCVSPENKRAVRFYDKNGFQRVDSDSIRIGSGYTEDQIKKYLWYQINKRDWDTQG